MSADEAAALVPHGANVGMSGFTGAGYPKAVAVGAGARASSKRTRAENRSGSASGPAPRPRPNSTARWPRSTASRCACPTSPIRSRASASTPARWSISTSTSPCRAVRLVRLSRQARHRGGRGRRHPAGRPSDAVVLDRQQQDLARPGRQRHPRGQLVAEPGARGHARHLLRHQAAAAPAADPDPRDPATGSARPRFAAIRSKVIAVVETNAPDRNTAFAAPDADIEGDRGPHPRISRARGSPRQAAARTCCRCSPGSATSPTP